MDFINWLTKQEKLYDPHENAKRLLGGKSLAETVSEVGGYEPQNLAQATSNGITNTYGTADLTGNTQSLLTPSKLQPEQNQGGFDPRADALANVWKTPNEGTRTYSEADLGDNSGGWTPPVAKTQADLGNNNTPVTPINDPYSPFSNQAMMKKVDPNYTDDTQIELNYLFNKYNGDTAKALIGHKMGEDFMDEIYAVYGDEWLSKLNVPLVAYLKQFNAI